MLTPFIAAMIESVLFGIFSIFIFYHASKMQDFGTSPLSAGLFPALIAGLLLFLSIALSIQNYRAYKKEGNAAALFPKAVPGAMSRHARALLLFLLAIGYTLILPILHFFASSVLFMVVFLLMAGERRWWAIALVAVGLSGTLQLVFGTLLNVLLP
jgi:hypothetical protein